MGNSKQPNYMVNTVAREINLKEYYEVIKKRIWLIVIVTLLTTVAGAFYNSYTHTNLYESSRRIIIGSDKGEHEYINGYDKGSNHYGKSE